MCRWRITNSQKQNGLQLKILTLMLIPDIHSMIVPYHLQIFNQWPKISVDVIPRLLWPQYLAWQHNIFLFVAGRFKIISTIGHELCVLLLTYVLIVILIFLGSLANSRICESMFHHCVVSVGCLIIPVSWLCFSLSHCHNSDSFLFAKQRFKCGVIGK
jgi:hypothetical protein